MSSFARESCFAWACSRRICSNAISMDVPQSKDSEKRRNEKHVANAGMRVNFHLKRYCRKFVTHSFQIPTIYLEYCSSRTNFSIFTVVIRMGRMAVQGSNCLTNHLMLISPCSFLSRHHSFLNFLKKYRVGKAWSLLFDDGIPTFRKGFYGFGLC